MLMENADTQRIRKQAKGTYSGRGNNRFYVLVSSYKRWFNETDDLLKNIKEQIAN